MLQKGIYFSRKKNVTKKNLPYTKKECCKKRIYLENFTKLNLTQKKIFLNVTTHTSPFSFIAGTEMKTPIYPRT